MRISVNICKWVSRLYLKGTRNTYRFPIFCRALQRYLMQRCREHHHQRNDIVYGHISNYNILILIDLANEGRFSRETLPNSIQKLLIFQAPTFEHFTSDIAINLGFLSSTHGISNHSTNILMRDIIVSLSDLLSQYVAHIDL